MNVTRRGSYGKAGLEKPLPNVSSTRAGKAFMCFVLCGFLRGLTLCKHSIFGE